MHEHDLDLIAAFASDLADGDDAARASDLVSSCDVCAEEYATQREMVSLLATAPSPRMTEFERARLHREVTAVIAPAPASERALAWNRRWLSLAGAAAGVFVLVGVVGVLTSVTGGDDSADDPITMAQDGEAGTTAESARVPLDRAEDAGADSAFAAEESTDQSTEPAAASDEAVGGSVPWLVDLGEVDREGLSSVLAETAVVVGEGTVVVPTDDAIALGAECAGEIDGPLYAVILADLDGEAIEIFATGDRSAPSFPAFAREGCVPFGL